MAAPESGNLAAVMPWVLHVDLDQFIAAVEVLRRPELKGLPVVVGGSGDPTARGVVATASYEARAYGVGSGMPLRTAARTCPQAVFLPSDPPTYESVSAQVMEVLRAFPVVVEVMGWDEAFVGAETDDPEALARAVQEAVESATRLRSSVGIGDNKVRAKTATGFAKPAGVFRLTRQNWMAVMGERPTQELWGVGRKTGAKLAELGVTTVSQLATAEEAVLAARLGPRMGPSYRQLARGVGSRTVDPSPYVPRSRSREVTFQQNVMDWEKVREQVRLLARRVAEDVVVDGRDAVRVGVKLRYAPFRTHTHAAALPAPTQDADAVEAAVLRVLEQFERNRPVRLVGVRAEFERET